MCTGWNFFYQKSISFTKRSRMKPMDYLLLMLFNIWSKCYFKIAPNTDYLITSFITLYMCVYSTLRRFEVFLSNINQKFASLKFYIGSRQNSTRKLISTLLKWFSHRKEMTKSYMQWLGKSISHVATNVVELWRNLSWI